jgi:hypothetical protein
VGTQRGIDIALARFEYCSGFHALPQLSNLSISHCSAPELIRVRRDPSSDLLDKVDIYRLVSLIFFFIVEDAPLFY